MKLIRITKNEGSYIIDAENSFGIFGVKVHKSRKKFRSYNNGKNWFDMDNHKKVSKHVKRKLDKWLKEHQKFIED